MKYVHPIVILSSLILMAGGLALSATGAPVPVLRAPGGVSDFGTVANSATVQMNGQMTLEAWVHPTGWRPYTGREKHGLNFMYKGRIGSYIDFVFALQENGILCLGNTWGYIGVMNRRVPLNQWTHVAVTVNEATGSFVFYINGENCGAGSGWQGVSLSRTSFLGPSSHPLYVGGFNQLGWGYNNDNFRGMIADVRMWNLVRTPAEIAANYQKQLRGTEPGLAAYWTFADRLDKSPNGNHMTLGGNASFQAGQGPNLQGAGGIDVELTAPAQNQIVVQGADLALAATATAISGGVARVDFFANTIFLSSDSTAPYTATWSNVPAGLHTVSARATNNADQVGASEDVVIRVHGPFGGAAAEVPGQIEAEHFDLGGPGLGYLDTTAANEGGQYRPGEAVDITVDASANNGHVVGWTKAGEWMSYVFNNVSTQGAYTIRSRVAGVGVGGKFKIWVNGIEVPGDLSVPNTGAWTSYQWVTRDNVMLPQGVCTMRVAMVANGPSGNVGAFDAFTIGETPPPVQEPFNQTAQPWDVPGSVQCEDFDQGGEGLAYHEVSLLNEGGYYRMQDGVDIAQQVQAGNGHAVGWTRAGEWMEYTINVTTPGTYVFETHVAGEGNDGQFQILVDDDLVGDTLNVPDTGSWTSYQAVLSDEFTLTLGVHTVRVAMVTQGSSGHVGAFDFLEVKTGSSGPVQMPCDGTPVELPGVVQAEKFDAGGEGLAYHETTPINQGGQLRTLEGVDIAAHATASNGYVVGWTQPGEWLEYTVDVTVPGKYNLATRLGAQGAGGRFRVELAGATRDVVVPHTGGWYTFGDVAANGLELTAGVHTMRVSMVQAGIGGSVAALDQFAFTLSAQSAFPGGVAWPVPGLIEVENFDQGGPDVAYHDATAANEGRAHRPAEQVGISADPAASNGFVVGWTAAGEWLEYTISVTETGLYTITTRVAGAGAGGQFRILVGGVDKTGVQNVPNTGAWNAYASVTVSDVNLTAGEHRLRLEMLRPGSSGHVGAFDCIQVDEDGGRSMVAGRRTVAFPKPAEVRTSQEDQQPLAGWQAVDGDSETVWQGIPDAGGWWLALAYDSIVPVSKVTVDWLDSPVGMTVLYSLDAGDWLGLDEPWVQGPVQARYLWLLFPDEGQGPPAIREVNVE
ncbi:MAG: carbohydrate-binding protein [Kiritimatiellae bacterium]|jgi:hypothetical protein|nr:carbohydrate-binding protein [Kiritimatiellia bacterium]MDY0148838.1 carbohydrate-binding protein [Kiritimatiellia bacterium]